MSDRIVPKVVFSLLQHPSYLAGRPYDPEMQCALSGARLSNATRDFRVGRIGEIEK